MLLLLSSSGAAAVPPAFNAEYLQASIKQDDVGLHLQSTDLGWYVSNLDLPRKNINAADVGWKIIQVSKRWNIRKD